MTYRDKILSEDYAELIYPEYNPSNRVINRYNVEFWENISNTKSTLYLPLSNMENINFSNYNYGLMPKVYGLMDTSPLDVSGITRLANQPVLSLRGQGTIIGIIDTGIDYTNPSFIDKNGRTRILRIWDQTDAKGKLPENVKNDVLREMLNLKIYYGSEYTEDDINEALNSGNPREIVPVTDDIGHGTFMAGVAGGTPDILSGFSGAATEAKFIVVKLKQAKKYLRNYYFISEDVPAYQENDIIAAANYIRIYSMIFNMPVSLIVALGSNQGGHDGGTMLSDELSRYVNSAGTAVTVAAGSEGNARHHFLGVVKNENTPVDMEIRVGDNVTGFSAEIWVDAPQIFSVGIISPTGEVVNRIPARMGSSQIIDFIFERTRIYIEYDIIEGATGDELIFMRFREPTAGIWRIQIYGSNINTGVFNCWLPITQFVGDNVYFLEPDPSITITDPAMAAGVIAVTGYDSRSGAFFQKSGRGYTRRGRVAPDIAAPAVEITGPAIGGGFENTSGTSPAAAITAGACAQVLTWGIVNENRSFMSSAEVKSYLIRGATREPGIVYPNNMWGADDIIVSS